jgi:hypothetical protein
MTASTFVGIWTALSCAAALAQASAPLTRAEVKAETRSLERAGKLTPAGEAGVRVPPASTSNKTRAQVKEETAGARRDGQIIPAGERQETTQSLPASARTRAQVKAEVKQARYAGKLTPAGEASPAR